MLDTVIQVSQHNNKQNTIIKRNLCDKNVEHFISYLTNETWDIVYEGDAQKAFMWFQGLIDLFFDKCFPKQSHILTYRNRYKWMTNKLRTQISEKKILGYQAFCNPENLNLKNEYKQIINRLISDLRKQLKTLIGKHTNNLERKMSFSIRDAIVTDNQIIANEFNNLFVSICPKVAHLSSDVNPLSYVNNVVNSIVIPTITTLEVKNIISSTKNSCPGWDDFPATIAKKCMEYYINPLTHIIDNSIKEGVFPSELKLARVVPLLISGDSSQITNYRLISIL